MVVVAVLGSLAAVIMSAPRVYFAMARDGVFFPSVATLHKRFETPARATALQAVLASVLVVVGSFNEILSYFVFVVIVFVGLTVAALFKFRREESDSVRFLTPGYPVTPAVFLRKCQSCCLEVTTNACILGVAGSVRAAVTMML